MTTLGSQASIQYNVQSIWEKELKKNCKGRVGYPWILGQVNINAHETYL